MCRNIKILYNFQPPATDQEIRAAALQFVRKISGFQKPSAVNQAPFEAAVNEVAASSRKLLDALVTKSAPRDRQQQAEKTRARAALRFGDSRRQSGTKRLVEAGKRG